MRLILDYENNNMQIHSDGDLTVEDAICLCVNALVHTIRSQIRSMEEVADDKHALHEVMYDKFDALFAKALEDIFPDIKKREFDLLTAAIVKAQDDIINLAEEKGWTYEEALDYYNDLSNKYIQNRRLS